MGRPNISVLMTVSQPWMRDIRGYKVMSMKLPRLDWHSSTKLFLRRVRRVLRRADFDEFESSCGQNISSGVDPEERKAHETALLRHPLMRFLDGHPGRIRKAAEKVTDSLPPLFDLFEELSNDTRDGPGIASNAAHSSLQW